LLFHLSEKHQHSQKEHGRGIAAHPPQVWKSSADITAQHRALYYRNEVFYCMEEIRKLVDAAELIVGTKYWPYPSYGDMMFSEE